MDRKDILFVGGNLQRLASVKIRCGEIAASLGCDVHYSAMTASEVPAGYKAYLCVKPDFGVSGVSELSKRGRIIWDILDDHPPTESVHRYIVSTHYVANMMASLGPITVIPHYHCNFEKRIAQHLDKRVSYIGSEHWYPIIEDVDHKTSFVSRWNRTEVAAAYLDTSICINLRRIDDPPENYAALNGGIKHSTEMHIKLNSGIKLINCLGFGLPSVSGDEPAYHEIAPDCTIFSDLRTCRQNIDSLLEDKQLFRMYRERCLARADDYSLDSVVNCYGRFIAGL